MYFRENLKLDDVCKIYFREKLRLDDVWKIYFKILFEDYFKKFKFSLLEDD